MNLNLSLHRKLLLLVAVPLGGALVFAGIEIGRHTVALRKLDRADAAAGLAAELGSLRVALLEERRDVADIPQEPARIAAYREHINHTATVATRIRAQLATGAMPALARTDVREALTALLAAHDRLAEPRSQLIRPAADHTVALFHQHYDRYVEAYALVLDAVNLLATESDSAPIRARLEELVGLGRLAEAAENERRLVNQGFAVERLTVAAFGRTQNATAARRYHESNVVLLAPREQAAYWSKLLAHPVYARAAALQGQIVSETAAETVPFRQELKAEWQTVSRERNQLLDEAEPHLLAELRTFIAGRKAEVGDRLTQVALPAAALLVLTVATAWWLVRRIERQLRTAHLGLASGVEAIARAVAAATEAAQRLADGAGKDAAGLEQTGASLESLTAINQKNVGTARQAVGQMTGTSALVGDSREAMQALAETMGRISESSSATFRIVKTINEIAFQTNILALNASIEAASAGAAGTGFAVVADEVRNLAKRAAEATAETSRLVEEARAAIQSGTGLSHEVVGALREVADNATRSGELLASIHHASEQMLQNMQHINAGNRSLETVTQQNATIADHNKTTAGAIADETLRLQDTINGLGRLLHGARV